MNLARFMKRATHPRLFLFLSLDLAWAALAAPSAVAAPCVMSTLAGSSDGDGTGSAALAPQAGPSPYPVISTSPPRVIPLAYAALSEWPCFFDSTLIPLIQLVDPARLLPL